MKVASGLLLRMGVIGHMVFLAGYTVNCASTKAAIWYISQQVGDLVAYQFALAIMPRLLIGGQHQRTGNRTGIGCGQIHDILSMRLAAAK